MSKPPSKTIPDQSDIYPELPCAITIDTDIMEAGRPLELCLRPLHPSDRGRLEKGIMELSDQSRYLRFFSGFKTVPPSVVEQLADVDGVKHIGWGAINQSLEGSPAIGAVHAIRKDEEPDIGEFAIAVLDKYHGKGVARALTAVLFLHCVKQGMRELDIAVMHENTKAANLVDVLTARPTHSDGAVRHYRMNLESALDALRAMENPKWLQEVFTKFDT
ncbi:GNAT family N-acetyltransferase [Parasphingorhabdus sp. JC815]|uniref:GNAT family N-acetyltransferase n=1 Tax=Parasphingorhabdus sp. JC815 TaxID=3232140 RepID=UPI003459A227